MSENTDIPSKPQSRVLTVLLDKLPEAFTGRIKQHEFVTTLGAGVVFEKADTVRGQATFKMRFTNNAPLWTAKELQELALECIEMAKYLDKIST